MLVHQVPFKVADGKASGSTLNVSSKQVVLCILCLIGLQGLQHFMIAAHLPAVEQAQPSSPVRRMTWEKEEELCSGDAGNSTECAEVYLFKRWHGQERDAEPGLLAEDEEAEAPSTTAHTEVTEVTPAELAAMEHEEVEEPWPEALLAMQRSEVERLLVTTSVEKKQEEEVLPFEPVLDWEDAVVAGNSLRGARAASKPQLSSDKEILVITADMLSNTRMRVLVNSTFNKQTSQWEGGVAPEVTCVTVLPEHHASEAWLRAFLENFRLQTYEGRKHLVLVHHATDLRSALVVRKVTADAKDVTIGVARGDVMLPSTTAFRFGAWISRRSSGVIARWDYDAFHHPERLATQIRALALTGRPASLLSHWTALDSKSSSGKTIEWDGERWGSSMVGEAKWMKINWFPMLKSRQDDAHHYRRFQLVRVDMEELVVYGSKDTQAAEAARARAQARERQRRAEEEKRQARARVQAASAMSWAAARSWSEKFQARAKAALKEATAASEKAEDALKEAQDALEEDASDAEEWSQDASDAAELAAQKAQVAIYAMEVLEEAKQTEAEQRREAKAAEHESLLDEMEHLTKKRAHERLLQEQRKLRLAAKQRMHEAAATKEEEVEALLNAAVKHAQAADDLAASTMHAAEAAAASRVDDLPQRLHSAEEASAAAKASQSEVTSAQNSLRLAKEEEAVALTALERAQELVTKGMAALQAMDAKVASLAQVLNWTDGSEDSAHEEPRNLTSVIQVARKEAEELVFRAQDIAAVVAEVRAVSENEDDDDDDDNDKQPAAQAAPEGAEAPAAPAGPEKEDAELEDLPPLTHTGLAALQHGLEEGGEAVDPAPTGADTAGSKTG